MRKLLSTLLLAASALVAGCAMMPSGNSGWTTLIEDGRGMENFNAIGDANWRTQDGTLVADAGKGGYLVTKKSYKDFQIRAEFWADHTTNSGIFIRSQAPGNIEATTSYEVNIFDQRPDPTYGTGAIVDTAKVLPMPKAGGKWNTFEIVADGSRLMVFFNGVQTVDVRDAKFAQGPFALQFGNGPKDAPGGAIKWRKVQVRAL